jgi:hypothetical protein
MFTRFSILAILLVISGDLFACDKCFGAQVDTPTTQGIGMAMLTLLGMTGGIGSGVIFFFIRLKRRTKLLAGGNHYVTRDGKILPSPINRNSKSEREEIDAEILNLLLGKSKSGRI